MKKNKKNFKNLFSLNSKVVLLVGVIILIFFSIALSREVVRKMEINREIAALETEINSLEGENQDLADLIAYLNSTSWQEKEAREKLNLQKPGETVVAILRGQENQVTGGDGQADNQDLSVAENDPNTSNSRKWFNYFFN